MGEVVYPNDYLKSKDIKKGDRVCYTRIVNMSLK